MPRDEARRQAAETETGESGDGRVGRRESQETGESGDGRVRDERCRKGSSSHDLKDIDFRVDTVNNSSACHDNVS